MLQTYYMRNIELNKKANSDKKSVQLTEASQKEDDTSSSPILEKYNRKKKKNRKRDFASQVFEDTGFICEV